MNAWSKAPLTRILLPLMLGIITAWQMGMADALLWSAISILCFLIFLVLEIFFGSIPYRFRLAPGIIVFIACYFAGIACLGGARQDQKPDFAGNYLDKADVLAVRINNIPTEKAKSWKCPADIIWLQNGPEQKQLQAKVIIYLSKDSLKQLPRYGDELIIRNKLQSISPPANPEEFDYKRYMALQNVFYTAFLKQGEYTFSQRNNSSPLWKGIFAVKIAADSQLARYIPGGEEKAVAKALILGDEGEIPAGLMSAYAGSGTLHVLSVSGLHIGALMELLLFLTLFLKGNRFGQAIRVILLLSILWGYALLTGFSAPVARSAFMFSAVIGAVSLRRVTNIYNTLAISAILILLIDPLSLMQVSFQLSFIALLGIAWLQPYIAAWWEPENKWVKKLWLLISTSLAAQIAILPIGIYYFNQAPMYFLPANLVIIPYSTIVLFAAGIFILVISWIPVLASPAAFALKWIIFGLNACAKFFNNLPYASLEGWYLKGWQCLILCLSIALLVFALVYRQKKWLWSSLAGFVLLLGYGFISQSTESRQARMNIWDIPKTFAITIQDGNKLYLITDSAFANNEMQKKYYINRFAYSHGIPKGNIISIPYQNGQTVKGNSFYYQAPLLAYHDSLFYLPRNEKDVAIFTDLSPKLKAILLITAKAPVKALSVINKQIISKVIINPDVKAYKANKWKQSCEAKNIPCISLEKEGNFVFE